MCFIFQPFTGAMCPLALEHLLTHQRRTEWNCGMMTGTEVCAVENEKDR